MRGLSLADPGDIAEGLVIQAYVNHGRWVADCPFCTGAERVSLDRPQFMCLSCFNAAAGGRWLRMRLPRWRGLIEAELLKRPRVQNRNWRPGETVASLRKENREHGIESEVN